MELTSRERTLTWELAGMRVPIISKSNKTHIPQCSLVLLVGSSIRKSTSGNDIDELWVVVGTEKEGIES